MRQTVTDSAGLTGIDEIKVTVGTPAPVNGGEIPEFPTLALPVVAILGLAFMFQRKKE